MSDALRIDGPLARWVDRLGWEWRFEFDGVRKLHGLIPGNSKVVFILATDSRGPGKQEWAVYKIGDVVAEGVATESEVLELTTAWALLHLVLANADGVGWVLTESSDDLMLAESASPGRRPIFEITDQVYGSGLRSKSWWASWAVDQHGPRGDNRVENKEFGDPKVALAHCVDKAMQFATTLGLLDGQPQGEVQVDDAPIDLDQLARTREALSRLPD